MLHPATTIKQVSKEIGLGVYATDLIPAGTIVYAKDPLEIEILNHDSRLLDDAMRSIIERYSYREPGGARILSWDLAKYVNHSCNPNTISTGYGFEIAIRDILPGEQITDDYGMLNIEHVMKCGCRSDACRKTIKPNDLDTYADMWDTIIKRILHKVRLVDQPLYPLLEPVIIKALDNYFSDNSRYQSVSSLACRQKDHHQELSAIDTVSGLAPASGLQV